LYFYDKNFIKISNQVARTMTFQTLDVVWREISQTIQEINIF